ncbi:hypothetical protein JTE90_026890, partial [Oedothorax gibbosus]
DKIRGIPHPRGSQKSPPIFRGKPQALVPPVIEEEETPRRNMLPDQEGKRRRRKPRRVFRLNCLPSGNRRSIIYPEQSTSSKYRLSPTSSENASCGSEDVLRIKKPVEIVAILLHVCFLITFHGFFGAMEQTDPESHIKAVLKKCKTEMKGKN